MDVRVTEVALARTECRARVPFRFGGSEMSEAPLLHARVEVEAVDGRRADGLAADLLVPKWFRKDPATSVEHGWSELRASVVQAAQILVALGFSTPFELWRRCHDAMTRGLDPASEDLLVRGFGAAMLERAVIDAVCRLSGSGIWGALRSDLLGFRPEKVHPFLMGWRLPEGLPERPRGKLLLRHTVGLSDPIRRTDAGPRADDDGLPASLEEEFERTMPSWLKIKAGARREEDLERLCAIAALCRDLDRDVRWTLDGNERFGDLDEVADLLDEFAARPEGARMLRGLAFVEQPVPRARTFDAGANRGLRRVAQRAPLLIDEADQDPHSFPRAWELGWRGVSVKNCKGFFRALLNLGVARTRARGAFLSAEDLTTLPVMSLQQDLATVACLGLEHVERNGHHYFRGLEHLPAEVASSALENHPDLYEPLGSGAALRVTRGEIDVGSLFCPGFGCEKALHQALLESLPFSSPIATRN
ncbi:MAG: mandelate racemase [Planctomycetota bacterium]